MNTSIDRASIMVESVSGIGTGLARDKATSMQGILEHILNFFTFGYLSRQRAEEYDAFAEALATALYLAAPDGVSCKIPPRLVVDFAGCTATFTLPDNDPYKLSPVIIDVSKDGKSIRSEVDRKMYCRSSTALLIRRRAGLPHASIILTERRHIDLQKANLMSAVLNEANLGSADMRQANLRGTWLHKAHLWVANLDGADLRWATLTEAQLGNANLQRGDLRHANLSKAKMTCTDLRKSDLRGADLRDADLREADLRGADLREADLRGADLREANLRGANLRNADLRGANLTGVDLSEVDLSWAILNDVDVNEVYPREAVLGSVKDPEPMMTTGWPSNSLTQEGLLKKAKSRPGDDKIGQTPAVVWERERRQNG